MMTRARQSHRILHQWADCDFLPGERLVLLHHPRRAQHLLDRAHQTLRVFQHHLVKLVALFLVQVALLQRLQVQVNRGDGCLQLVRHRIQEAVLLLVTANLAHQKNRIENDAGNDETEENDSQNERHQFAPVEYDPTDVEHHRRRGQQHAQRDEKRDCCLAASDAHGDELRIAKKWLTNFAASPNVSQGGRGAAKSSSIRQRSELNIRKSSYGPSPADLLAVLSPNVSIFCQGKTEHSPNRPAYPNSSGYSLPFSSAELRLATAGAPGGTAPGKDSPSTATPRPCVR